MSDPLGYESDLTTAAAFMSDTVRTVEYMTRGRALSERVDMLRRFAPIELRAASSLLEADEMVAGDWLCRASRDRDKITDIEKYQLYKDGHNWMKPVFMSSNRGRRFQR